MKHIKPKIQTKITYRVIYTPQLATNIFDLMSKCDLGIAGGKAPVTETWSWETTTKVDANYRAKMRRVIIKALNNIGVTQIHSIKKIK